MTGQQGRLNAGHQVAGRYQVARLIGAGDVGEVYDVRDVTTGYAYALKLLRPEIAQNPDAWTTLCSEAQKASGLEAESIAKAYEFQTEPSLNAPYVLGEYVTYPSLHTIVSEQGPMGLAEFDVVLRLLAHALDAAHQAGLVHRAIKPQNVFANPVDAKNWQVRITDFGVGAARVFSPPPPGWTATPGWLSAEQADPSTAATPSMDVYALGLLAFYALTGKSPFLACRSDPPDLNMLWAEMTAPMPTASQRARELGGLLSPTLDVWFAKALAVSPSQRFRSVGEMSQELFALVGASHHVPTMRPPAGAAPGPAAPVPEPPPSAIIQEAYPEPAYEQPYQQQNQFEQQQQYQQDPFQQQQQYQQPAPASPAEDITGAPMPNLPQAAPASLVDPIEAQPKKPGGAKLIIPIAIGGGLAFIAVLGIGAWLVFGGDDTPTPASSASAAAASVAPPASAAAEDAAAPAPEAAPPEDAAPDVEAAKDALVTFACDPKCEEVVCDGKKVEDVGAGVKLEEGKHTCVGKLKGYIPAKDTFSVKAGEDTKRDLKLSKIRYTAPPPRPAKTCGTLLNPCK